MFNPPRTKQEAEKRKYGKWAGNPSGHDYDPKYCAYEAYDKFVLFYQCTRTPGHGPDALYCKQHAKMVSKNG